MDILSITLGLVLGILLAIGGHMALRTRTTDGFAAGFLVYFFTLMLPLLLVWVYASPTIALIGFFVGLVLSAGLVYGQWRETTRSRQDTGSAADFPTEVQG